MKRNNAAKLFRKTMQLRRTYGRNSDNWDWLSRAARKYVWMMRGVPVNDWPE